MRVGDVRFQNKLLIDEIVANYTIILDVTTRSINKKNKYSTKELISNICIFILAPP